MMNYIKKHILIIIIIAIIFICTGIFCLYYITKDTKYNINDLEIKYINGDIINIKNISSSYEKEIIITNKSSELKTYSLEWTDISNNFVNQDKFLYTITGEGARSASLGKSQVPNTSSKIFNSVAILGGVTHTYKIKFIYLGGTSNNKFTGKLKVSSYKIKTDNKLESGIPFKDKKASEKDV